MTLASPDRALATMALIDANARRGKTHLDNFVPFALEALRTADGEALSPGEVANAVAQEFGLRIPNHAMESVLKRSAREKLVTRKSNRYSLNLNSDVPIRNLRTEQQRFLRQQSSLCVKFVEYCAAKHSVTISAGDAESALYDQIERSTIALLSAELTGGTYTPTGKIEAEHHFLAADFITYVAESDEVAYDWLVAAAKGATLSAALHLPNEYRVDRKFTNTDIYLDAPLLLKLVGLEGEEAEQSVLEVVRSARSYGANIAAFAHSMSEAEGVISAAADVRRRGASVPHRSNGVLAYAIRMDLSSSELQLRYAKFSAQLSALGVVIREKPEPITSLEVGELELAEELQEAVGYRFEGALHKDVDSLRGIHFIRRGRSSKFIEDSRAVLLTDNDAVARVARRFFRREGYDWPVATLISDLATLLYIKEPQKSPELPRLQMVAGAYSALEPGVDVWNAWLQTIEQLKKTNVITGEDIALLCHTDESRRMLMHATLGDASKVVPSTVQDVLTETRRRVAAPYEAMARVHESESIKAMAKAEVLDRVANESHHKIEEIQSEINELKARNATYRGIEAERLSSIQVQSEKYAAKVVNGTLIFLVIATVAWAALSFTGALPSSQLLAVGATVIAALFVIGALQKLFGGHVKEWLGPLEKRLAKRKERSLKQILNLAEEI